MNCNIIKDLIPLYIDDCCSEESHAEVKKHIESCGECKKIFESMTDTVDEETKFEIKKCTKINNWKASILQSVLFLISFFMITVGVYFEAGTNYIDFGNSLAAFNIVVPATGFLLSLTNWYFVNLYPSRKIFSWCSCIISVVITLFATVWCSFHYNMSPVNIFSFFFAPGIFLTVLFAVAAKALSCLYAKMLGKE